MRRYLPLSWRLALLLSALACAEAAQPAKGVFETCPACRLNAMPELKRFLHESILKKEYGEKLTVKFIFGKTPTLLLYDDAGTQISATEVDPKLKYDELHTWVQGMGFVKQAAGAAAATASTESSSTASAAAPAPASTPTLPATAAADGASSTAAAPIGPAPVPLQPEQLVQQRRRRRRRRHMRGSAAGAGGGDAQRRRRQRQQQDAPGNLYM